MDTTEDILVIEAPTSRFKKIITSRPATYIGAAVVGALSVVAVAAIRGRDKVETMTALELDSEPASFDDTSDVTI